MAATVSIKESKTILEGNSGIQTLSNYLGKTAKLVEMETLTT
jgi:hypothetical protein